MHWGVPSDDLADYQVSIGRAAITAGADLILGHGPHAIHALEVYDGRPIFYSLGNLIFDWPVMSGRHTDGLLVNHQLGGSEPTRLVAVRRSPTNVTTVLDGTAADRVLGHVASMSAARGTIVTVDDGAVTVHAQ